MIIAVILTYTLKNTVYHFRERKARYITLQPQPEDECCCSAHFLLFVRPGAPAQGCPHSRSVFSSHLTYPDKPKHVGLGTRGFPQRSLAKPAARVPAKGSECKQGDEVSAFSPGRSVTPSRPCTESCLAEPTRSQTSEACGRTSGRSSSGEKISSQVLQLLEQKTQGTE